MIVEFEIITTRGWTNYQFSQLHEHCRNIRSYNELRYYDRQSTKTKIIKIDERDGMVLVRFFCGVPMGIQ